MGNNATKQHHPVPIARDKHKKSVHWKSAERPSPPGRPILVPASEKPDVINIKWERPRTDGGSPLLGYIIEYRRTGSSQWIRATPSLIPINEYMMSGLEPGWRYQFHVIAENVVGKSDPSLLSDGLTVTLQRNTVTVPHFVNELNDITIVENDRIELRVSVIGTPTPEISWFKDGFEIFSSRRTKIINENDSSILIIHQAALTDEGEIKCTATNRAGHVVTRAKLKVEAPPKIRLPRQYEDGLIVEADDTLRLKVGIAGQPPPKVLWSHEGNVINNGGRYELITNEKNSSLKITNIKRSDQGEYSLRAINKLNEDVAFILVTVTSRPTPPGKVKLSMSFGKSTRLTWTAPVDDGGCKIGNYIIEYFRIGWNVWLKAATTRQLQTTLHDLIEGSQYKFRVKAENPYGLSDPSEESDVLFIPDPKRGIKRPEEIEGPTEEEKPPLPPKRKTLSPLRNFLSRSKENLPDRQPSPKRQRSPSNFLLPTDNPPQIYESETLSREMSYGASIEKMDPQDSRRSPSLKRNKESSGSSSPREVRRRSPSPMRFIQSLIGRNKEDDPKKSPNLERKHPTNDSDKSPKLHRKEEQVDIRKSPNLERKKESVDVNTISNMQRISESANINVNSSLQHRQEPQNNRTNPALQQSQQPANVKLSPILQRSQQPNDVRLSPSLQRSQEPIKLNRDQNVHNRLTPSPIMKRTDKFLSEEARNQLRSEESKNNLGIRKNNNQIQKDSPKPELHRQNPIIQISSPEASRTDQAKETPKVKSIEVKQPPRDNNNDLHTSSEFMLVLYHNKKSKENEKQESFDLELDEALSPPPLSLSSPDLAVDLEQLQQPIRRCFSSTELLYERAMARFYEAVELEEAERNKKRKSSQDQSLPVPIRKRLGSMGEAERLSFERRSSLRKRLSGEMPELTIRASPMKSDENLQKTTKDEKLPSSEKINEMKRSPNFEKLRNYNSEQKRGSEDSMGFESSNKPGSQESMDFEEDYTDSTASSDDSIEKFKIELMARTRTGSEELQTYHPRNMSGAPFSPYRVPTPDQSSIVLSKPVPLPSPDFVPKPILKRSSVENVVKEDIQEIDEKPKEKLENNNSSKKGLISFFKKEKASSDQNLSLKSDETIGNGRSKNGAQNGKSETDKSNGVMNVSPQPNKADILDKRLAAAEELRRKKLESRQSSQEETKVVVEYYNDIVRELGRTRKSTVPIYLSSEELKKAADKADEEEGKYGENEEEEEVQRYQQHQQQHRQQQQQQHHQQQHLRSRVDNKFDEMTSSEEKLMERQKPKHRLSIVERMQIAHVKNKSDLAVVQSKAMSEETDDQEKLRSEDELRSSSNEHIVGVAGRARTGVARKPKRVIGKASNGKTENNVSTPRKRFGERTRITSKSPAAMNRKALQANSSEKLLLPAYTGTLLQEPRPKTPEDLLQEVQVEVRSTISYISDLGLFLVACWVYIFKDAILVLPILLLLVYRQIGEAIMNHIPDWMKRKKS